MTRRGRIRLFASAVIIGGAISLASPARAAATPRLSCYDDACYGLELACGLLGFYEYTLVDYYCDAGGAHFSGHCDAT